MVEELLGEACSACGTPGAVLAIATFDETEEFAAGLADAAGDVAMRPEHQFPPMSITKSMTAALLVDACRARAVPLDTEVEAVLKPIEGVHWPTGLTFDHLLACTGGLSAFDFPDTGDNDDAIARFPVAVGDLRALFPPGERFSYSNTSFSLAAAALEQLAGAVFDDLLLDGLFRPLGLAATGTWYRGRPATPITSHFVAPDRSTFPAGWWRVRSAAGCGAGTLFSTAGDLARYGLAHLDRWTELREPQAAFPGPHATAWGRGWALYDWDASVFGWDGFAPGAKTFLRVLPEHGAAISLCTNGSNGREVYRAVLPTVLDERFGVRMAPESWPRPALDAPIGADHVIGRYRNGSATVTITTAAEDDDGVRGYRLQDSMGRSVSVQALDATRFVLDDGFEYPTLELDGDLLFYFCSAWVRSDDSERAV